MDYSPVKRFEESPINMDKENSLTKSNQPGKLNPKQQKR